MNSLDYINIAFEDGLFMSMAGYRDLLTDMYGDYMELPPLSERVPSHLATVEMRANESRLGDQKV